MPRRRLPVEVPPAGIVPSLEVAGDNIVVGGENSIRSKILSHFANTNGNSDDDPKRIGATGKSSESC